VDLYRVFMLFWKVQRALLVGWLKTYRITFDLGYGKLKIFQFLLP